MNDKIRIFLADDHQVLIDGMFAVLKTNPLIEVVGHSLNGDQLIEKVCHYKADILVMDINMPVMNGWDFLNQYLKEFKLRKDRIIVLSSSIDFQDRQKAKEFSCVEGFIEKPLSPEKIKNIL